MSGTPDLSTGVHVIVGDSAGGTLQLSFPTHRIERVVDNFSVGPLRAEADEQAALRQTYWERMESEIGADPDAPPPRPFNTDADMVERVRADMRDGRPLVLWVGRWAFERVACAWLIDRLLRDAPKAVAYLVDSKTCLSLLPPSALNSLAESARPLVGDARASALSAWGALHDAPIPAFRWHSAQAGDLSTMPDRQWRTVLGAALHGDDGAVIDARILAQVTDEWTRAAVVVGHVLADCPIGDRILHWRVVRLCRSGHLEYEGELHALRHFRLRRE